MVSNSITKLLVAGVVCVVYGVLAVVVGGREIQSSATKSYMQSEEYELLEKKKLTIEEMNKLAAREEKFWKEFHSEVGEEGGIESTLLRSIGVYFLSQLAVGWALVVFAVWLKLSSGYFVLLNTAAALSTYIVFQHLMVPLFIAAVLSHLALGLIKGKQNSSGQP